MEYQEMNGMEYQEVKITKDMSPLLISAIKWADNELVLRSEAGYIRSLVACTPDKHLIVMYRVVRIIEDDEGDEEEQCILITPYLDEAVTAYKLKVI